MIIAERKKEIYENTKSLIKPQNFMSILMTLQLLLIILLFIIVIV